jgi:hypothetical protein
VPVLGTTAVDGPRRLGMVHGPDGSGVMPMEHVNQPLVVQFPEAPEAIAEVLGLAAGQGREGGLHGSHADIRPHGTHQADGLVSQLRVVATTRASQGVDRQVIFMPAMFPEGQGAGRQTQLRGSLATLPSPLRGPVVEGHGMQACVVLGFTPPALCGPAAFSGLAGTRIHGFRRFATCCNRWRRRFRARAVVFSPAWRPD